MAPIDTIKYKYLNLLGVNQWGILMHKAARIFLNTLKEQLGNFQD